MAVEIDLKGLNATERAILALLAQGHTAKSIAAETGRSEGAVNERLREARRKTGVSSSRELARLLRERENGDEQIEMAVEDRPAPAPVGALTRARWQRKVLLMTLPLITLAAVALVLHGAGQQAPTPPTPSAAGGAEPRDYAESLRARFAGESRDPAWADGAQDALERRYHAIGGPDLATLTIACRSTLCEIRGQSISDAGTGMGKRLSKTLGSPAFRGSVPGLHADVTNTSGFVRGSTYFVSFDAIWRRIVD